MCGVTGWFSPSPIHATEAHPPLSRMVKQIHHRGPDGEGVEFFDHAVLGHVRLAIIDPMYGAQPMYSHDKRYCISFNGEIYNYRDLKAQLTNQGHHFSSNSDTEVIMALYRAYGWQGFTQLRGMYAVALWDCEGQTGLLVRDPLGIKPLFIHQKENKLTFASEAKAILAKKDISAQLNPEALHLLLNFRYLPGNRSLFKNIQQLPAGTVLEWSATSIQQYPLPETNQPDGETLEILAESVRLHLTSDVEVDTYLSGGIDSATIVWDSPNLRRRIYGPRMLDSQLPNAFTILEELWPDENDPVMAMAQFELKNKMVNDLLWQEDRVSMEEGLEARVPFVDKSLIAPSALSARTADDKQQAQRLSAHTAKRDFT
jgi:asparagine synthase (glutamine-hydrolysing)